MMLFGTDGIRGKANHYPITAEMALKIGKTAALRLKEKEDGNMIVIGRDTRVSGEMLEYALAAGICSMGFDVVLLGILPTPGIAFMTKGLRASAGIVISASHNPYYDNGIKFFSSNGFKLSDKEEEEIESLLFSENLNHDKDGEPGRVIQIEDAGGRYIEYLKGTFPKDMDLEGLRLIVDCANGAAYRIAPSLFRELGATVISIHDEPDGKNINLNCGSTDTKRLQESVQKYSADLGIAFDGDADRVLICDENGTLLDGDKIMGICAKRMKSEERLKGNAVVASVMSNLGLEKYLENYGIKVIRTPVGDRAVMEEMRRGRYNFGGEQSGHIIFLDHSTTGDGLVTALQVLAIVKKSANSISEHAKEVTIFPQVLVNVKVAKKKPIEDFQEIKEAVKRAEALLDRGRILIRPSGTEPKIRVMVEGEDIEKVEHIANELARLIKINMK